MYDHRYVLGFYSLLLVSRSMRGRGNLGDRIHLPHPSCILGWGGVYDYGYVLGSYNLLLVSHSMREKQPKRPDSSTPPLLYYGAGRGVCLRVCPTVLQSAVSFAQHEGESNLRGRIHILPPLLYFGVGKVFDYGYVLGAYNLLIVLRSKRGRRNVH